MMFWAMFGFELRYQLRRISTWIYFGIFLLLTFAMVLSFTENVYSGDYFLNAPVVIAAISAIASLLALLVIAAVAGEAATHDLRSRIDPLLYTTPVSKFAYLGGKLMGAFAVVALVMLALPLGLLLALVVPGIDPVLFGPFQFSPYLSSFLVIALPAAFVSTAMLFSLALLSRHAMVSFLSGGLLFMMALTSKEMLADQLGQWDLAKQLDFSCFTIVAEFRKTQTPLNINTQLLPLDGWLLWNRLLWLLIAFGFMAVAFGRFRFAHHVSSGWWSRIMKRKPIEAPIADAVPIAVPQVQKNFRLRSRLQQTAAITLQTYRENMKSWGWIALSGIAGLLLVLLPEWLEGSLGVPTLPTTARITAIYNLFMLRLVVVAVMVVYAGQLIWRERDARISDIADAAPVPNWVLLFSKLSSLVLMLLSLQLVFLLAGIATQLSQGYKVLEIGLYLRMLFGLQLIDYLLVAVLGMVVHVLVNHKYLAHIITFVTFLFSVFAHEMGVVNKLLIYGADLGWSYSDMRGFGSQLASWIWFKLYWVAWALLLALLTLRFWVRGRETGIGQRIRRAVLHPSKPLLLALACGLLAIFSLGAFVFYQTDVLTEQLSKDELLARRATYEQLYGKYHGVPQPTLTATSLHVEFFPDQGEAWVSGVYTLQNKSRVAIDTIHIATALGVDTRDLQFDRATITLLEDQQHHHSIFILEKALQPGDSLELSFDIQYMPKGFARKGADYAVTANGSYFLNHAWLPAIGYQANRELHLARDRQAHQLPPKPAIQPLQEGEVQHQNADQERIRFEAVVGTSADQTAVTSGALQYTWTEKGRRYFYYVADAPIRNLYTFYSAAYAIRETEWQDILIQVLYHPAHVHQADRLFKSAEASLKYYTRHFGPYPHRQLRLVEYPGAGGGASAYPGTIALTENFSMLNPEEDWRDIDLVFAVGAHEVAHQWWAHQLVPADMEGAALLTESLAWYSALGVVEATYGAEHLERLLWVMRQSYLTPRSKADVPLLRASDPFMRYRKGPFAMYALKEYLGEEQVNRALCKLLQKFGSGEPPLSTSLHLYRELQAAAPDSLQYLLVDLFEKNTYWNLETKQAVAVPTADGQWSVTLDVRAQKSVVDTLGRETAIPVQDLVEVGVYAAGQDGQLGELLYLEKHRLHAGEQQIQLTVPAKPAHAGIDPRNLLIDLEMMDNVRKVTIQKPAAPTKALYVRQSAQLINFMLDTMF
ncbi:ABC transporter permease [Pontibacter sp. FD36]|uniref:ABC transporter permease/M1 family aminopeptidase n=1 Tax=Pontibacter sp. FD36 TaxID=2789860 RepID=UPI0018ABED0C|nr:M1 family aminopeptidase [Pontibacter sp. FD36]MBF8965261.1 ABC transporter permease [Pontibacter sp. FD36]